MTTEDYEFILELFGYYGKDDEGFLRALKENPDDEQTRLAWADFLEEHNRPESAKLLRKGWIPGQGYWRQIGKPLTGVELERYCKSASGASCGSGVVYVPNVFTPTMIMSGMVIDPVPSYWRD